MTTRMSAAEYRARFGVARSPLHRIPLRQHREGTMNKTEQAYANHLRHQQLLGVPILAWYYEPAKWKLPGTRNTFTPDFLVRYKDGTEEWVEVKAAWRVKGGSKYEYKPGYMGDARTKLKTFAGSFPHLTVRLRWYHPAHGVWEEERIL